MSTQLTSMIERIGAQTLDWGWHARQPGHHVMIMGKKWIESGPLGQPYASMTWRICTTCGEKSEPICEYSWS
jgi:hypothetical protein